MTGSVAARRLGGLINCARTSSGGSRSILPFLPRPMKWLMLLIMLLNVRSWPGAWHGMFLFLFLKCIYTEIWVVARVLSAMVRIQLSRLLNWRTHKTVWWESVSPVGRTPFPTPHAQGPNQSVYIVNKLRASKFSTSLP